MNKQCPFCGGNGKLSIRQGRFYGQNCFGDKKMKMVLQVICNRCHARSKPITTDWLVNPNRWNMPQEYYDKAWEAWNTRDIPKPSPMYDLEWCGGR